MRIKNKKNLLIFSLLTLVLLTAGYFTYAYTTKDLWPFVQNSSTNTQDSINYNPPTEQEIESSQDGKKNSADGEHPKDNISVDIAYAGSSDDSTYIDIRAFTTGVIEGSGTCTATLTLDSETVIASAKAFIDARSSICEPIEIPLEKFNKPGLWRLVVDYSSPSYSGASVPVEIEVNK